MTHILVYTYAADNCDQYVQIKKRGSEEEMKDLMYTLAHAHLYEFILRYCEKDMDEFAIDVDDFKEMETISVRDDKLYYNEDEIANELDGFFTDVEVSIKPDLVRFMSTDTNSCIRYELFQIIS
jgi:hypothetical protein